MNDANRTLYSWFSKRVRSMFCESASNAFGFLNEQYGMIGPSIENEVSISFQSPNCSVEIGLAPRDGLCVVISADDRDRHPRASLTCLYVEGGLGPAQDIKCAARTPHTLGKSVDSNAVALKKFMSRFEQEQIEALLLQCHGR